MASPFAVFRKHQKVLLATVGLLAMIAFVFLGPAADYLSNRRVALEDPVLVSWDYGDIRQSELRNQMVLRNQVNLFVASAYQQALQNGATSAIQPQPLSSNERDTVRMMLLAKRGEELGMVFSDGVVNEYLRRITADAVPADQLNALLARTGRLSMYHVFDVLRTEMLAQQFYMLAVFGIGNDGIGVLHETPAERYAIYEKLERKATIEAAGLSVADFVDQVSEPSDADLLAFFEEHRDRIPRPDFVQGTQLESATPAFKLPQRVAFTYVKASLDNFVEAAKEGITDEDVAEYYEKNKDILYRETGSSDLFPAADDASNPAGEVTAEASESAGDALTDAESPEGGPAADAESENTGAERAASDDSAPESTASDGAASESADVAEEPDASVDSSESVDESPESSDTASSDSNEGESGSSVDDVPPPASQLDDPVNGSDADPDEVAINEGDNATDDSIGDDAASTQASDSPAAGEETAVDDVFSNEAVEEEVTYQPLDKVRDEVRLTLARQRGREQVRDALQKIDSTVSNYARDVVVWQAKTQVWEEEKEGPAPEKPTRPDIQALAEQEKLGYFELGPISGLDLNQNTDLGKSFQIQRQSMFEQGTQLPFVLLAYRDQVGEFEPIQSFDVDENQYLAWKTETLPEKVPEFDEVRDEVLLAWKRQQAADLALAKAKQLAEKARDADSVSEALADEPGVTMAAPPEFSWLSSGLTGLDPTLRSAPRLTELDELPNAGPEFMQTVFGLAPGEVGVALNHPKSMVYVVKLKELEPSDTLLRNYFQAENYRNYSSAAAEDRQELYQAWIEDIENEVNLEWNEEALNAESEVN